MGETGIPPSPNSRVEVLRLFQKGQEGHGDRADEADEKLDGSEIEHSQPVTDSEYTPREMDKPGHVIGGSNLQECIPLTTAADEGHAPALSTEDDINTWPGVFSDGKADIGFEYETPWALPNEVKGWIEDFIGIPINWWPLYPRRRSLPNDYVRVNWTCVSRSLIL